MLNRFLSKSLKYTNIYSRKYFFTALYASNFKNLYKSQNRRSLYEVSAKTMSFSDSSSGSSVKEIQTVDGHKVSNIQ